jgi:hypothetical protein
MNSLRHICAVGALLIATTIGCGDNQPPSTQIAGQLEVSVGPSPSDVTRIHVAVTGPGIPQPIGMDLTQSLVDMSWSGTILNVPPGVNRTVAAQGFDGDELVIYEGEATNVTVLAGKVVDVPILLKPSNPGNGTGINTPPHFVDLEHPDSVLNNATATFFAAADDPDDGALLTYTWSIQSGGGQLSVTSFPNKMSDAQVSTVYTPAEDFTGFAVIQVQVSDGIAMETTTFAIAVGAGINPGINFDVLPLVAIVSAVPQVVMPTGTSTIQYTLTNPNAFGSPDTMHVQTSWSDPECNGTFDAMQNEMIDIAKGQTVTKTLTYTATNDFPPFPVQCVPTLTVVDAAQVQMTTTVNVWMDPPLAIFVSSTKVDGAAFSGAWQHADDFCQTLANNAGPFSGFVFHALLSFDEISAKDRLVDAPYWLVDGTPVARNKAELFSGTLLHAINKNENGDIVNDNEAVYTGTNADGSTSDNCSNWMSNSSSSEGQTGFAGSTSGSWTADFLPGCDTEQRIYCVMQSFPLL